MQIGDRVRFRAGKAPDALKGREDEIGVVIDLDYRGGPQPWPTAQFGDYITPVLMPGLIEVAPTLTTS